MQVSELILKLQLLFYRLHGGDNVQVKRYFVSFWNGVDLRYKLLKGPKIRISIAGIIISRVCMTFVALVAVQSDFKHIKNSSYDKYMHRAVTQLHT